MESLRVVVSAGVDVVVSGLVEDEDMVSVAAGADDVEVVSVPVVLALLAQLVKATVADTKATQTAAVLNN